ncbi:MAG: putative metal-binding motif-containing protein [Myxococcota bacterium]|nr:putative metal-binding motif-containing protein [Myxococcota bacterium]
MKTRAWTCALALLWLAACDDSGPEMADAAAGDGRVALPDVGPEDAGPVCERDRDCDDGLYCTGVERCAPGDTAADASGCVAGSAPCAASEICEEDAEMCREDVCSDGPSMDGDADGDGDPRPSCGGTDCDDADPRRYGTAQEVCDAEGVDEDCDATTIHDETARDGDRDGDGFIDVACFNLRDSGGENRGTDCDDGRATINTSGVEACDGRDNDCDTRIDEGVLETFYRDVDGDNYGDPSMTMMECTAPTGWVLQGSDCDDRNGAVHPGAADECNGVDDDCSGTVDDPPTGCMCTDGAERDCGPPMALAGVGICRRSSQRCVSGRWPTECPGAVYPRQMGGAPYDPCGNGDEDCDGTTDEDGRLPYYRDADRDGYGDPTMRMDFCPGDEGSSYVDNDQDCDDGDAAIHPMATEICDMVDNDCRGGVDDVPGGCGCSLGDTQACGTDVGRCSRGSQTCTAAGTWGPCSGTGPRVETCDGGDDDCDARTDEDFDCVQSTTASGTTACGNPGSRRCSASCTWTDADFYASESAATCDYCDDSGMGLGDEIPFAGSSSNSTVTTGWRPYGDAGYTAVTAQWSVVSSASDRGGLYMPSRAVMGYGPTYVRATVDTYATRTYSCGGAFCSGGLDGNWSLVVLPESATSFVGSSFTALPRTTGLAVSWHFTSTTYPCSGICAFFAADQLWLKALRPGAEPVVIDEDADIPGDQDGPMGTWATQSIWIEIIPDDPRTAPDETEVGVIGPPGTGVFCRNALGGSRACGMTIAPGDELNLGIVAASTSTNDVRVLRPEMDLTRNGLCGP